MWVKETEWQMRLVVGIMGQHVQKRKERRESINHVIWTHTHRRAITCWLIKPHCLEVKHVVVDETHDCGRLHTFGPPLTRPRLALPGFSALTWVTRSFLSSPRSLALSPQPWHRSQRLPSFVLHAFCSLRYSLLPLSHRNLQGLWG